jgi:hypothetical protein
VAGDGASLHMDKLGPRAGMQVGRWKEVCRGSVEDGPPFEQLLVRKLKLKKHITPADTCFLIYAFKFSISQHF